VSAEGSATCPRGPHEMCHLQTRASGLQQAGHAAACSMKPAPVRAPATGAGCPPPGARAHGLCNWVGWSARGGGARRHAPTPAPRPAPRRRALVGGTRTALSHVQPAGGAPKVASGARSSAGARGTQRAAGGGWRHTLSRAAHLASCSFAAQQLYARRCGHRQRAGQSSDPRDGPPPATTASAIRLHPG
jgi:hypothetical protein